MMFNANNNINYYKLLFENNGVCNSSIGWNRDNQILRFDSLLLHIKTIGNLGKIIDVGSGFSDLYFYLIQKNIEFDNYIGFEIIDDFYNIAQSRVDDPKKMQVFNSDFLDYDGDVDTIIGSGIFGMGNGSDFDMLNYVDRILRKSCDISNSSIAFNFLSANSDRKSSVSSFQPSIRDLVDIVSKYSSRYIFDHSYSPYEFTLTIFINQKIDKNLWFED
jgi:hypothetical protein